MAKLLDDDEPRAFSLQRPTGSSAYVLVCDHAGRVLPRKLGTLGVGALDLLRHIAWDIGAAEVARRLSDRLDAFSIAQTYSRLVIDCNRTPGTPQSIVSSSERTRIPGNEQLPEADATARAVEIFHPYHERITAELDRRAQAEQLAMLVSVHSFTPSFMDVSRRWHAGVLYNRDARLGRVMLDLLRQEPGLEVGENEPYAASEATDFTIVTHGEKRGLIHVELEIRQDLIAESAGQAEWAERLARLLGEAQRILFLK